MPDFTANIAFLFPDLPFLDRIDAAKAAGFDKVECHFPYEFPLPVLKERLTAPASRSPGSTRSRAIAPRASGGLPACRGGDQFRRDFAQVGPMRRRSAPR